MRRSLLIIAGLLLALGVVEGVSYWWMHPKPAGLGEPVLVYRPGFRGQGTGVRGQESEGGSQGTANGVARNPTSTFDVGSSTLDVPSLSSNQKSKINNHQSSISPSPTSTHTLLPDVVAAALPSLRCTTGTAARIDRDDDVTLHVAFFEWDLSSSTSVLEAFKHLPEECMGSIGMTLVEKAPVRTFVVGSQRSEVRGRCAV